ncbi:MAG: PEP-CTERM sorting domain-containing protein [Verrucomicrobia bacterium]|nr:PEP-CTERM sorting domain-containing protein [Verrucomicrobiota bacterium]
MVGGYSYNGGNQTITLVPEPSTGALMALSAVGMIALRRLRKV